MSLREYVIEEKRFCEFKIKTLERVSSPSKLRRRETSCLLILNR